MRGKRLNTRDCGQQQVRRQSMDSSLFYYQYLNNSLNYILSGSNDLDHMIHFDNLALKQIISNQPNQESLHFVERVKMMKTKCDQSLYLKDIQEYGQFINYELSKSNRQQIMSIQGELQEQFKINILTKRLKKKYRTVDERTNLYQLHQLQKQMKKQILENLNGQEIKYDRNLEENRLYREMFNIQEVKVKKEEKIVQKKIEKTKSNKGNKKQKDQEFYAPASVKYKPAQSNGFSQKMVNEDKPKRQSTLQKNYGGNQLQPAKLYPQLKPQKDSHYSSLLNPPNLIQLPNIEALKQKVPLPVPQVQDPLPNWGAMQVEQRMNDFNQESIPQKTQHPQSNQLSKHQLQANLRAVNLQKKPKKQKKIEKQDKQKPKKPKTSKNKQEKPQKQKRPYNRKPLLVPSQNVRVPQSSITSTSTPVVIPPIQSPTSQQQIQVTTISINEKKDVSVQADTAFDDSQNGIVIAPRVYPFSFTPINPSYVPAERRSESRFGNQQNKQNISERVSNHNSLQVSIDISQNKVSSNNNQRMDVQNKDQAGQSGDIAGDRQSSRKESFNIDDMLNI